MEELQHEESSSERTDIVYKFQPFKLVSNSHCYIDDYRLMFNGRLLRCTTPPPRSGHRVVCDDVHMYSFGGYNPALSSSVECILSSDPVWSDSKPLFKELWKYNLSTSLWIKQSVRDLPDILASNALHLSGNLLMVYGGTGVPFGENCSNDLYICDLRNNPEQLKFNLVCATGNCPLPLYGQAIVVSQDYLYTIGGTTGFEYTCDIHRLNLRDNVWESLYTCKGSLDEPQGRYRHEVAFYENQIFLLGGGTSRQSFDFENLFTFNLNTNKWVRQRLHPDNTAREGHPIARRCHSCVQIEHKVYIIGGSNGQSTFNDIWRLDLKTLNWTKLVNTSFDRGVYFHSSCITPSGKMYTFGGITQINNTSRRTAEIHSAWLCIPKLKEICWEAILFYCPELYLLSESDLYSTGLPKEFINRLSLSDLTEMKELGMRVAQAHVDVSKRRGLHQCAPI